VSREFAAHETSAVAAASASDTSTPNLAISSTTRAAGRADWSARLFKPAIAPSHASVELPDVHHS
jgi:hypothetical protein